MQLDLFAAPPAPPASGARNSYLFGLSQGDIRINGMAFPDDAELRAEDLSRPVLGDIIKPGMVVQTSYGTGPYLVHRVTAHAYYDRFRAWSLVVIQGNQDGTFKQANGNNFGYLNELVVSWESGQPHIRHLFLANDDEVTLLAQHGFIADRAGQLAIL